MLEAWVAKWTEEMAVENGWKDLAEMAMTMGFEWDKIWMYDGEAEDDDIEFVGTEDVLTIVDYVMGRVYMKTTDVTVLRREFGADFGNERLLIRVDELF